MHLWPVWKGEHESFDTTQIGKDKEQAENLATKEGKKAEEKEHKGAAGDKLGEAWDNIKGGKDHASEAAGHNKEKNKIEGQQKVRCRAAAGTQGLFQPW